MASSQDNVSMALFCDFENVALGVRDANYEQFDIKPILERLLLKGSIVIKKAYCDWDRYKGFKKPMHEANFELIEIPHVRQSGKNSADIRLVVDALDLCYTKSHVNTFVIISGDSDFSPLVSKLRENNKQVIGVGVKQSTSDLLVANCDEFIFYDDLVRENQRRAAKRGGAGARDAQPAPSRSPEEERRRKDDIATRRSKAIELAVETFDALVLERGDGGKMWASVLKEAIKRRKPDFNESYYGFRAFGNLLEEAQARGLLEFGRDEKSGTYVYRGSASLGDAEPAGVLEGESPMEAAAAMANGRRESREGREGREGRKRGGRKGRSREEGGAEGSGDAQSDVPSAGEGQSTRGFADDADGRFDDIQGDDETGVPARDSDSLQSNDARWPDVRDESPVAPWDELPAASATQPQRDPFEVSSPTDEADDAVGEQTASMPAPAPVATRKPPREPARKRREAERGRGRNGKPDAHAATEPVETPPVNDAAATADAAAEVPASASADKPRAPKDLIGNATLLPEGAPTAAPSKAVVTRVPRRRGGRAAAEANEPAAAPAGADREAVDATDAGVPAAATPAVAPAPAADDATPASKPARKTAARSRRPRKTATKAD